MAFLVPSTTFKFAPEDTRYLISRYQIRRTSGPKSIQICSNPSPTGNKSVIFYSGHGNLGSKFVSVVCSVGDGSGRFSCTTVNGKTTSLVRGLSRNQIAMVSAFLPCSYVALVVAVGIYAWQRRWYHNLASLKTSYERKYFP